MWDSAANHLTPCEHPIDKCTYMIPNSIHLITQTPMTTLLPFSMCQNSKKKHETWFNSKLALPQLHSSTQYVNVIFEHTYYIYHIYIYNLNNLLHKCATQRLCNLMPKLTAAQRLYRVIPHETQFSRPISFLVSLRIVCCWCASTLGIYTRAQCGAKQGNV